MTQRSCLSDHPCRRRGHAHEERPAEGAAQDRRPADGRACRARRRRLLAAAISRWWSATAATRCAKRRPACRQGAKSSSRSSGWAPAHAVLAAREAIARGYDDILVMFGDTPLVDAGAACARPGRSSRKAQRSLSWASAPPNPAGYGRLIEKDGETCRDPRGEGLLAPRSARIDFCNGGLMAIDGTHGAGAARCGRQRQRQGRILSHRHRRDRPWRRA